MVHFVGAGPGGPDLITLRGAELLGRADCVVYAGSLVNPALLGLVREGVPVYNSAQMTLEQVLEVLEEVTSAAVGSPIRVMLTVGGETPSAPRSTRSAPKPPRPAPEQTPTPEEERPPLPEEPPLPAEPSRPPEPKAEEERPPLPEEPSAQEENAPPWEGGSKDRLEELIGPGSQLEHFKIK